MDQQTKQRLDALRARLDAWRCTRERGRIPERFWQEALELAARSSIGEVSRILLLDPQRLERRLASNRPATVPARPSPPVFVELDWSGPAGRVQGELELADADGATLRVRVTAGQASDVATIASALWRTRR